MSVKQVRCLGVALLLSCLGGTAAAGTAQPCAAADVPALELRIVAAGLAPDMDRSLVIQVFEDGCVQLHRPAYRRDAGDFRLDLDTATLDSLRRKLEQPALHSFDAARVQADIAAAQRKRSDAEGRAQRYSEPDGDVYAMRWRSGTKRSAAAWAALPGQAQTYPDNAALQAFHAAASAVQALAERSDAVRIAGGRP